MKKIQIKKISLKNFGGVANGVYELEDGVNIIEGASGTGKSSLYNGYLWALGFTVPTWEPQISSYRLWKVETSVFVELCIDGVIYNIGKTNNPKYKINKFTAEEEYVGTEFKYWVDGQVMTAGDYKDKISELFDIDYFTLELITNITLFNGEDGNRWNKNERRKFLFKLFDLENKILELKNLPEFESIKEYIEKGNDEIEINTILNTMKTNIEREMRDNQVIIQERQDDLASIKQIDFEALEKQKEEINSKISDLSTQTQQFAENSLYSQKLIKLQELENNLRKINFENKEKEDNYSQNISSCEKAIDKLKYEVGEKETKIKELGTEEGNIEKQIDDINAEEFDENTTICPTCYQKLPENKIEELKTNFIKNKTERIATLKNKLSSLEQEQETAITYKKQLEEEIQEKKVWLEKSQNTKPDLVDTQDIQTQIDALKKELETSKEDSNEQSKQNIANELESLKLELDAVTQKLAEKNNLEKINLRINELKNRTKELGVQDSQRVTMKHALQLYTQKKVALVNEEVNKHFEGVSYNFFKWNSGASASKEYLDICEAVLKDEGTAFECCSSGQQVKVNLFTNNSLRKILNINMPQFVDDIVLSDIDTKNQEWQTIYLLTKNDKKPKVNLVKDIYTIEDCDVKGKINNEN